MHKHPRPKSRSIDLAVRWLVWCLLISIPVCGLSSAMSGMLGASHYHREMATTEPEMQGWQDFRRADHLADGTPRTHTHAHFHGVFERHHHDASDPTVVAIGGGGDQPLGGDTGSGLEAVALFGFAPGSELALPDRHSSDMNWPLGAIIVFESCDLDRLYRPPQA